MPKTQVQLRPDAYIAQFEEQTKDIESRDLMFLNALLTNELDVGRAAQMAGITPSEGGRIRRKAEVQKFLQWHLDEFRKDVGFHLPRLASQVIQYALFDPMPILAAIAEDDWVTALERLTPEQRACIQEVSIGKSGKPYVKFVNKTMASDQALRMLSGEQNISQSAKQPAFVGVKIVIEGTPKAVETRVDEWKAALPVIDTKPDNGIYDGTGTIE